ncbi:MAG: GAF domain-containing protein [Chloroflexia bacterium]
MVMSNVQGSADWSVRLAELEGRLRLLEREYQSQRQELRAAYQEIQVLSGLQDVALALASTLEPEPLLRRIVSAAMELMHAQGASLLLLTERGDLVFQVVDGAVSRQLVGRRLRVGEGISGWVAQTGEPALVNDVQSDPRFSHEADADTGFRTESLLCVPLEFQGRLLGVLTVVNKTDPAGFEPKDLKWLKALAAMASVAIENSRLYNRLREERDRVLIAQEELRKKLARDLHDGPTQTVSTIVMQIEFLKKLLEKEPDKVAAELDRLSRSGQQAVHEMRTMLFDLRPLVLETQGLPAALQLFTERHQVEGRARLHLYLDESVGRYPAPVEGAVFSIVQEAVNNALKHAQAQNIWLRLGEKGDMLVVEVEDDGVGFSLEDVLQAYEDRERFGLLSMRERAELLGGELTIVSAPGQGTTVMLRIPMGRTQEGKECTENTPGESAAVS